MNFFDFFNFKTESGSKEVGSFDCDASTLTDAFVNLSGKVGIKNPTTLSVNSAKGISIQKKGDKYIIKLLMFTPPVELEWTDLKPMNQLFDILNEMTTNNKKVGYLNIKKIDSGISFFQLALSK